MQKKWRKLDNSAKIFSFAKRINSHVFRLSAIMCEKIDVKILENAVQKSLKNFPSFKVKKKTGLFWNYLEENLKNPKIEIEHEMPCLSINLKRNNDYLFKVTYYKNKINLDIFHILTDGMGATYFFKEILTNYLNIKYKLITKNNSEKQDKIFHNDAYLECVDKTLKPNEKKKKAFSIPNMSNYFVNKIYHYIVNLDKIKEICKEKKVTITEYLGAIYIYAIYKSLYIKSSKKDITLCIPIDLRKHYNIFTTSNFFTYTSINGNILNNNVTFDSILLAVHKEFQEKVVPNKVPKYLTRDVNLGMNLAIRLVPLFLKKIFMKYFGEWVSKTSTSILSNIGKFELEEQYKKYIDNILILVMPGTDKIKCTICSFNNNLTITLNSNLIDESLEKEIYYLLKDKLSNVKLESNMKVEWC